MVASTVEAPKRKTLKRPQGEPGREVNQLISHRLKAQVRTLYLVEGNDPSTIERLGIGLTAKQISNLAHSEGWSQQRRLAAQKVKETTVARADAAVQAVAEAIAIESEELCFRSLDLTRAGLLKGGLEGAKQAQAASSTLKNLHSVAQSIRKPGESAEGSGDRFNFFFMPQAAPVVPAADAKQVTEIEARPNTSAE